MLVGVYGCFIINFLIGFRIFFLKQFRASKKNNEYYFKLDGYYYCSWKKSIIAVFRVRNKRTTDKVAIKEIVNDKEYLKEMHPVDAFIIGILANNERNGVINSNCIGWRKMKRSKGHLCSLKTEPVLEISSRYITSDGSEMIVLRSKHLNKEIKISTLELCKNQALLYALDSFQAIALGYDASEFIVRKMAKGE